MAEHPATRFPNYLQIRSRVPMWLWHAGRAVSVLAAIGLCVTLVAAPATGLKIWWQLTIPLLPLLWLTAPGLWRNLCPLAASNQIPRLTRVSRGLTVPDWYREYAPVAGMTAFILLVALRRPLLNGSGIATAVLIAGSLTGALVGGLAFKGKSGWCSSICPLLPVQRIYGQTPYITVPNSHCRPCVGCTKNCYDFNPGVAYLADLHDDDPHYTGPRRFFAGAFPGLIFAYFTMPAGTAPAGVYGRIAVGLAVSAGSFFLAEALLRVSVVKLTAVYGAAAISLFYWYAAPVLAGTLTGDSRTAWFDWPLRVFVWSLAAAWLLRTWRRDAAFLRLSRSASAAGAPRRGSEALDEARAQRAGDPEVTIAPQGVRLVTTPGTTLLELLERAESPIEAGCRMGVCGADPVCIVSGMQNLSPITPEERDTLVRLGYAESTRMACCARVEGAVEVSVTPQRSSAGSREPAVAVTRTSGVDRVVVIGNGIAGVTAADHVRRRNPDCTIDIVADEPYPLYNRMGIARLVYGRSAMIGLQLLPDAWYEDNVITCWLNTTAVALDTERRQVTLGTQETLDYDRLILAMGSDSSAPPIGGFGAAGTFVLRRAADALAIRSFAQRTGSASAVIAGGGLLGLETADALRRLGLRVLVLERGPRLLSRQLDDRGSELLREFLEGLGLHIMLNSEAASVRVSEGRVTGVVLTDGRVLDTEVVLAAAGISPLVGLARQAGLRVNRGVMVDDRLCTSVPDVFAAGDVAEHRGRTYGLWPAAVQQAEIAAENASGGSRIYSGTVPVAILKVVGVDLVSVGQTDPGPGCTVITREDAEDHSYRKLVIEDGRIVGAILIACSQDMPGVLSAVRDGYDVADLLDDLARGDWSALDARTREPLLSAR